MALTFGYPRTIILVAFVKTAKKRFNLEGLTKDNMYTELAGKLKVLRRSISMLGYAYTSEASGRKAQIYQGPKRTP